MTQREALYPVELLKQTNPLRHSSSLLHDKPQPRGGGRGGVGRGGISGQSDGSAWQSCGQLLQVSPQGSSGEVH